MAKLLLATHNPGKAREMASLLLNTSFTLTTLAREGIDLEVEETGCTLEQNAVLKAKGYSHASGLLTLADDSGLEVEALDGLPGVYSSRYAGPSATDDERVRYLLTKLEGIPTDRRGARFRCVIALADIKGRVNVFHGSCEGEIALEPRGYGGFGYDPVFYLPQFQRTMAELSWEEKNNVSHRADAARQAIQALQVSGLAEG